MPVGQSPLIHALHRGYKDYRAVSVPGVRTETQLAALEALIDKMSGEIEIATGYLDAIPDQNSVNILLNRVQDATHELETWTSALPKQDGERIKTKVSTINQGPAQEAAKDQAPLDAWMAAFAGQCVASVVAPLINAAGVPIKGTTGINADAYVPTYDGIFPDRTGG